MPRRSKIKKKAKKSLPLIIIFISLVIVDCGAAAAKIYSKAYVDFYLLGKETLELTDSDEYKEEGFKAEYCLLGNCEDLSEEVIVKNPVETGKPGEYRISYQLLFREKLYEKSRLVKILDKTPPVLELEGDEAIGLYIGENFDEPGFSAFDNADGDLTEKVEIDGSVDSSESGVYELTYSVEDSSGNSVEKSRLVFVYEYYAFRKTPTPDFDSLVEYIEDNGWNISLGFENLDNNYSYSYRENDIYYGASLVKAIDALYVYENMTPDLNLKNLVRGAITYSNNNSHIALVNRIGYSTLKQYGENLGMEHILNGSQYFSDTYYFNDTDVEDQMIILKKLWRLVNDLDNGEELKNYFINNFWDNLRFKNSPTHLYKNGLYGKYYHEIGIMLADSPYAVVILTTEGNRWNCTRIIRDLSHRIYMLNAIYSVKNS